VAFTIAGAAIDPHNGLNTDGLTCDAFNEETWFPSSSPVANTAEPGTPDATDTSGPAGNSGQTGHYLITVPKSGSYWVATYNDWDPTVIAWVKVLSHPHTQLQGWTAAVNQSANRRVTATTIASGSNGVALPATPIHVASTAPAHPQSFTSAGFIFIGIGGLLVPVAYTGISGTSFTGCTGGTGTMLTGQTVFQCYQNGPNRRQCYVTMGTETLASGDFATIDGISTVGGAVMTVAVAGINATSVAVTNSIDAQISFPVDPFGFYGVLPVWFGTGTFSSASIWIEVDF